MELAHEWSPFFVCIRCGVSQYEASVGGQMYCESVDEADTPILVEAAPDG